MKKFASVLLAAMIAAPAGSVFADAGSKKPIMRLFSASDTLFQVSTLGALTVGGYDGSVKYGRLARNGDFGLGTFDKLDGEMVAFDGKFYQITADGVARSVDPQMTTPYAAVTFFEPDKVVVLNRPMTCQALFAYIDKLRSSANRLYAVKLSGTWALLKTRSVAAQTHPFPPLSKAIAEQSVFNLAQVNATLAGFWMPPYMAQVNSPGYHFHALTDDKMTGGHVLDCRSTRVRIELDAIEAFMMVLPVDIDELDLSGLK